MMLTNSLAAVICAKVSFPPLTPVLLDSSPRLISIFFCVLLRFPCSDEDFTPFFHFLSVFPLISSFLTLHFFFLPFFLPAVYCQLWWKGQGNSCANYRTTFLLRSPFRRHFQCLLSSKQFFRINLKAKWFVSPPQWGFDKQTLPLPATHPQKGNQFAKRLNY